MLQGQSNLVKRACSIMILANRVEIIFEAYGSAVIYFKGYFFARCWKDVSWIDYFVIFHL